MMRILRLLFCLSIRTKLTVVAQLDFDVHIVQPSNVHLAAPAHRQTSLAGGVLRVGKTQVWQKTKHFTFFFLIPRGMMAPTNDIGNMAGVLGGVG